jgi:hypothetical protein
MDVIPDNLKKPLYLFNLPQDVLETLARKTIDPFQEVEEEEKPKEAKGDPQADKQPSALTKGTSCSLCGLSFGGSTEQRQHVKSDLHRYNLKRKIKGQPPVSETDFDKMIGELDESISGSESSESESDGEGEKEDILTSLLKRQAKLSSPDEPERAKPRKMAPGNPPLIWLTTANAPDNVVLGVYRSLFTAGEQADVVTSIQKKQLKPVPQSKPQPSQITINSENPAYFLCMIGGGHFAAMIVSLAPKYTATHNATTERTAVVLAHKTFHRYTTRRKQGGAQSASDAAKGAAHSAGSSLRRANEAALTAEVRALLADWRAMVDRCELLFVRATGAANRRTLYGPYEGQALRAADPRARTFPFTTRRATQAELVRAFGELTRVKVRLLDDVAALNPAPAAGPAPAAAAPKPKPAKKPSATEEAAQHHTVQLTALIRRAKIPAVLAYFAANGLDARTFAFAPADAHRHAPTPLHLAAHLAAPALVTALLVKAGADPSARNADGRTPAQLARDRPTRDAFRAARFAMGERPAWVTAQDGDEDGGRAAAAAAPWDAAGVGAPLSPAEAAARDAADRKEAERAAAEEARRRREEVERLRAEDEREKKKPAAHRSGGAGRVLGGGGGVPPPTGAERREMEARGMNPAVRAALERERRARAAEERFRRMGAGGGS